MSDLSQLHSDNNIHSIGDVLRTRREELKLSLEDVAQRLRIRLVFLKALEDGRIDQLPGVAYAAGFLKTYADFLNLDGVALVKQFRQENQANTEKPKLLFPAPVPQSGVPAGVLIFFSLLIMVGAYIGWYKMSDHHQSPSETIPPAPVQADQNAGQPQQMSPQIASIMPADHPAPLPQDVNKPADINSSPNTSTNTNAVSNAIPATPLTDSLKPASSDQSPLQPAVQPPSPPEATTPPVAQKQPEQPLVIKAIAPSWLQVKGKDGKVLYQKVLKADETWEVPSDQDELVMTIGNPGVVVLQKGDIQSSPLGKKGRTLRRFKLDAQKADKLLHPEEPSSTDSSSASTTGDAAPQIKKKPAAPKPVVSSKHDVSADDLNAKQLNH